MMKDDTIRLEIYQQEKVNRINLMNRMAEHYRKNQESLRVNLAIPEILSIGAYGSVISVTLNKAPQDPKTFCQWLQHLINMNLGGIEDV